MIDSTGTAVHGDGRSTRVRPRIVAILVLAASTMLIDGFDNQLLGFAVTEIARDFGTPRAEFGWVLAIGFVGLGIGTVVGGLAGDRIGRKPTLILAVTLFGAMTALSSLTGEPVTFALCRFVAGAGLGMALPSVTALIAEFSPPRWRNLAIAAGIACVPGGALVGGIVAAAVLPTWGWRALYVIGGLAPLLLAVALVLVLVESPQFLAAKRARRIGAASSTESLTMVREVRDVTPPAPTRHGAGALLARDLRRDTLALWAAFFFSLLGVFSFFSWGPSMLQTNGYSLAAASLSITLYNLGGITFAVLGSLLMNRYGSRVVLVAMAAGATISAAWLLLDPPAAGETGGVYIAQIVLNGGCFAGLQTVLYNLAAHLYPARMRATGVGAAGTVGRVGAIAAALAGGGLVSVGGQSFYVVLVGAALLATVALALVRNHLPAERPGPDPASDAGSAPGTVPAAGGQ